MAKVNVQYNLNFNTYKGQFYTDTGLQVTKETLSLYLDYLRSIYADMQQQGIGFIYAALTDILEKMKS